MDAATATAVAGALVDLHGSPYGEVAVAVPFTEILAGGVPPVLAWGGALGWRWLCTSSSPSFAPPSPPSAPALPPSRASWPCIFPTLDLINRATGRRSKYEYLLIVIIPSVSTSPGIACTKRRLGAYDSFYFLAVGFENLNSPSSILLSIGSPCFPIQKCHGFPLK